MTKRILTFLVAFLATLSGAVWGQNRGNADNPLDIGNRSSVLEIDDSEEWFITTSSLNTKGIVIKSGGVVDNNHNKPTIHLINVNLQAGGSAIIAEEYTDPIIILEGVNTIQSNGTDAAIRVPTDPIPGATLTIDARSTGILNIIMEGNENTFSNKIAIGNTIAGPSEDIYDCGSITVNGGTIKTNGRIGRVNQHGFRFSGNAIVIANEIAGFNYNDEDLRNGGLLFLNDDTPYVGEFHTPEKDPEFTLSSPLPEPYKIELRADGVKVEIGPDQSLTEEQLIDQGGQIKGYKVTYTSPDNVPMTTEVALPATKFVNSKYTVEKWDANAQAQSENTVYKHIDTHWLKNGTEWVSANTEVTESTPEYTTLPNIGKKEYQAVWYLQSKTISYNLADGFTGAFNLWYPDTDTDFLFTASEQSGGDLKTLAQVGLQLSDGEDGNGNTIVAGSPITDEGTFTTKLSLTSSTTNAPTGLETTLTVETSSTELDISDNSEVSITFNGGDFTYNGKAQENIGSLVSVVNASTQTPFTYGTHYFLKFTQDGNDATFQDAGDYTVKVVAVDNNGLLTGEKELTETVTIKPATLTIEVSNVEWTIGEAEPDYKEDAEFTLETIYSVEDTPDDVSINKDATGFDGSVTGNTWKTTPGTYTVNYSGLELTGSRAENYTLNNVTTAEGKLIVSVEGTTEDPIDDEGDNPLISATGDWADGTREYDGKEHPLTEIEVKNGTETATISLADVTITYSYQQTAEAEATTPEAVKNAGSYTATFTFPDNKYGYKGTGKVSLEITKATFTVSGKNNSEITVKQGDNINNLNAADYITITGVEVEGKKETPTISGWLAPNEGVSTAEKNETGFENAFSFDNVEVENSTNCLLSNYNEITTWPKIKLIVGPITINPDTDGSGDGDDEVIGGEDADGDGTFPSDRDIIILATGDAEVKNNVYNGSAHTLALLKIGDYTLAETTDYKVEYDSDDTPSTNSVGLPLHAATYSAEITLNENSPYELEDGSKEFSLDGITIAQRSMMVSFVKVVSSVEDLNDINKLVQFEEMAGNRGLVDGEEPTVDAEVTATDLGDGRYQVTIPRESFKISTNEVGKFYLSDYLAEVDFNGDGTGDADITDDNNDGEGDIDDGDGSDDEDIVIEVTVDPDGGDQDGDGYVDYLYYYNIYEDQICEGVTVEFSRDVVREGQSVLVTVKAEEGFDATKLALQFKRSLFGSWEDLTLTPTENPNEYIIKNIYTDIYVRAEGAVPTGIESIDGVKVYAKDGSLFVQTPQLENVTIVTITGAIVKSEQQVGLKQYTGLQRGIYVVRVGEQVFKVRN